VVYPSVPLFVVLALLPGVAFLALGRWGLRYETQRVHVWLVSAAGGAAMLVVALVSMGMYAVDLVHREGSSQELLVIPAFVYAGTLMVLARGRPVSTLRLALLALLGLVLAYLTSPFIMLFSACSFGDCL